MSLLRMTMSESPWLPSHRVFESSVFILGSFGRRRDSSELDRRTVGGAVVGIRPVGGGVGVRQSADDAAPEVQRRKRRLRDFVHIAGASAKGRGTLDIGVNSRDKGNNETGRIRQLREFLPDE